MLGLNFRFNTRCIRAHSEHMLLEVRGSSPLPGILQNQRQRNNDQHDANLRFLLSALLSPVFMGTIRME